MEQTKKSVYETAYRLAIDDLSRANLDDVIFYSSARLVPNEQGEEGKAILIDFLGETFRIEKHGVQVVVINDPREIKITDKILLLHYLMTADGTPLSRQEIGFEHIQDGALYYPTFKARTIDFLLRIFKNDLKAFLQTAEKIGGRVSQESSNQLRVKFLALPNIPIDVIYWRGDEELNPSIQIIYDANITHYLPVEDIVILTETLVHRLVKIFKTSS